MDTDDTLDDVCDQIEHFIIRGHINVRQVLELVAANWSDYGTVKQELTPCEASMVHAEEGDRHYRFATGGWSENEALINALNRNVMARAFGWCLSSIGGLHIYRYQRNF